MRPYTRVYAEIDLDAVIHNMEAMRQNIKPSAGIIGVVKADGYGHGAVPVAKAMDPYVCGYGVATIEEAIQLRNHGIVKPILILGVTHESRFEDVVKYEIRPAVFRFSEVKKLSKIAVSMGKAAKIHLAVDTGMSRIGMTPDQASADMVKEMSLLPAIDLEGMFTHFAKADETDKEFTKQQLKTYLDFVGLLEERGVEIPVKHCSNSAGIVEIQDANLDVVRAGISIYGLYPSDEVDRSAVNLEPVMGLKSCITYLKTIGPGTAVSYGGTYIADRDTVVATVPIGYGDGYPRNQSEKGSVLIHGKRARILGRVCMDQLMVDVTDLPEAREDDEVTLIGRDGDDCITVEEIARVGGGFHYEIICDIGKRVPRVYRKDGNIVGTKDYFQDRYEEFDEW